MTGTQWLHLFSSPRIVFYSKVNLPPNSTPARCSACGQSRMRTLVRAAKSIWGGGDKSARVAPTLASNDGLEHRSRGGLACVPERLSIELDTQTNPLKPTLHWGPFSRWKSERAPAEPSWLRFHRRLLQVIKKEKKKKKRLARPLRLAQMVNPFPRLNYTNADRCENSHAIRLPSTDTIWPFRFWRYASKKKNKRQTSGGFSQRGGNASDCNPGRHDAARCAPPRARVSPLWCREKRSWVFHISAKQIRLRLHLDGESLPDEIICIGRFRNPASCISLGSLCRRIDRQRKRPVRCNVCAFQCDTKAQAAK